MAELVTPLPVILGMISGLVAILGMGWFFRRAWSHRYPCPCLG